MDHKIKHSYLNDFMLYYLNKVFLGRILLSQIECIQEWKDILIIKVRV